VITIAHHFTTTTTDDDGVKIPRFTNFRAVIPIDESRRYISNGGEVSVRIEAHDAHAEMRGYGDNPNSYLWESVVPGVHVHDRPGDIQSAALEVLYREGVQLADVCWTWDGRRYVSAIEVAP
jgi:hypothetical protein